MAKCQQSKKPRTSLSGFSASFPLMSISYEMGVPFALLSMMLRAPCTNQCERVESAGVFRVPGLSLHKCRLQPQHLTQTLAIWPCSSYHSSRLSSSTHTSVSPIFFTRCCRPLQQPSCPFQTVGTRRSLQLMMNSACSGVGFVATGFSCTFARSTEQRSHALFGNQLRGFRSHSMDGSYFAT